MIAIKHRFSGATLCEFDVETVKNAVEKGKSNLDGANLRGADLRRADLRGANLRGSNLIVIAWEYWTTYITQGQIRIGCELHDLADWKNFTDYQISEMNSKALDFWKQNKDLIIGLCERFEVKELQSEVE